MFLGSKAAVKKESPRLNLSVGCLCGGGFMIELRQLHYLITIAEFRSIRAAAEALNIQQSTLSRTIRAIEDDLGAMLFERHHNGVEFTEAGQAFIQEIKTVIKLLDRAKRYARLAGRGKTGSLTIGIQTSLGTGFLKELLRRYSIVHPKVQLSVLDGTTKEHVKLVAAGSLDIAFITDCEVPSSCDYAQLWQEEVFVVTSKDHALSCQPSVGWSSMQNERVLVTVAAPGPEVEAFIRKAMVVDDGCSLKIDRIDSTQEMLLDLVALNQGITVAVSSWQRPDERELAYLPFNEAKKVYRSMPFGKGRTAILRFGGS
ncbi:MAG: LysR family transcriptional regulator [Sphingomonadales bacterium]|nr:MAG: LysR family transcriptional regulator [Sphingomonadales bacterium]